RGSAASAVVQKTGDIRSSRPPRRQRAHDKSGRDGRNRRIDEDTPVEVGIEPEIDVRADVDRVDEHRAQQSAEDETECRADSREQKTLDQEQSDQAAAAGAE